MKYQILYSGKKNINLSSAELAQRVVKVNVTSYKGAHSYTEIPDQPANRHILQYLLIL